MCSLCICGWCNVEEGHKRHLARHKNRELCLAGSLCELLVHLSLLHCTHLSWLLGFPPLLDVTSLPSRGKYFFQGANAFDHHATGNDAFHHHYRFLRSRLLRGLHIFTCVFREDCVMSVFPATHPYFFSVGPKLLSDTRRNKCINDVRIIILSIWINN